MIIELLTERMLAEVDEHGIGRMTFNNPAKRNALSLEMWQGVADILERFAAADSVRVAVMSGAGGKAFVSGADISEFDAKRSNAEQRREYGRIAARGGRALTTFRKPLIAEITGYCIGGGLATALDADIRFATPDSTFGIPAAKLGLGYQYGGLAKLARMVGPSRGAGHLVLRTVPECRGGARHRVDQFHRSARRNLGASDRVRATRRGERATHRGCRQGRGQCVGGGCTSRGSRPGPGVGGFVLRLGGLPGRPARVRGKTQARIPRRLMDLIDVYAAAQDSVHTYRIPALAVTRQGTLLAFARSAADRRRRRPATSIWLCGAAPMAATLGAIRSRCGTTPEIPAATRHP